jgi:hypothetical protein
MNVPPTRQKRLLLFHNYLHGTPHIATLHAFYGHDLRLAAGSTQIDLRVPVAKHVDMGWRMVIDKDDEAHAMGAVHGDHGVR